jgi:hypothetical protein
MAVTDWNVKFHQPHRRGDGPYYIGDFYVSRGEEMPKPVQVKLTYRAEGVFAGQLQDRDMDFIIREHIISRWGDETIHKWLDAERSLPDSFTLGTQASDDPSVYQLLPLDAQLMLKRWGLRE